MFGFEVVAVAAGIIAAFSESVSLYRSWKKERERRRIAETESLERSLSFGQTRVQQEYDLHFSRPKQRSAIGDGKQGIVSDILEIRSGKGTAFAIRNYTIAYGGEVDGNIDLNRIVRIV